MILMLAIVGGAAALRLPRLDSRPMHCDEAVHALKFGRLLERGEYVFDPREYHGPSLNYLTLPIAWLARAQTLVQVTEVQLRLLPAVFGIALVGLVWLLRPVLGTAESIAAAVLTAVSPAMVFYSRYYIQEMLLVCFTFGAIAALWRWRQVATFDVVGEDALAGADTATDARPAGRLQLAAWLVALGVCVGMMHATKETCIIALAAIAAAAALTIGVKAIGVRRMLISLLAAAAVAAAVSAWFFSSFFHNPGGVVDSFGTYLHYLGRASGEGSAGRQAYPWYHYFHLLFWWRQGSGPVWTEASIAALALVGATAGALGKGLRREQLPLVRFLAIYAALTVAVYSLMPYKTPWCALGPLHGMILLAGVGAVVLIRWTPGRAGKTLAIVLLATAAGHLAWQAWRASFVAYEDPTNPYVYAHTTGDVPRLAERVRQIAAADPDGLAMPIQVMCPDDDYWPLPWYLREFRRVGWLGDAPEGKAAPLIILQPSLQPALVRWLARRPPGQQDLYMAVLPGPGRDDDWQLRPNVALRMFVRYDLWETFQRKPEPFISR